MVWLASGPERREAGALGRVVRQLGRGRSREGKRGDGATGVDRLGSGWAEREKRKDRLSEFGPNEKRKMK